MLKNSYRFLLAPSRQWVAGVTLFFGLWLLFMQTVVPKEWHLVGMFTGLLLWMRELVNYAKRAKVVLRITLSSLPGQRYTNFKICFWCPKLIIVDYYQHRQRQFSLPILPDSLTRHDYYRLLQLTWQVKNHRIKIYH